MDSELLEKEYNELLFGLDDETAEKFRKFVEDFRTNLRALSVIDAQRTIKDFFKKVLGITEFDGRSWHKIILEEED